MPLRTRSNSEKAIPRDEALDRYWAKVQLIGAGPTPTFIQHSGRGFSPIWQLDPAVAYDAKVKREVKGILAELRDRAKGLAVDSGIYSSVNPFMKAPGAIHPNTGRVITFFGVGGNLYTADDFHEYFSRNRRWNAGAVAVSLYPDDPVLKKPRRSTEASRAACRRRPGPSYAVLGDLQKLLEHWGGDLAGKSNAFFRAYAWHRRNILMTDFGLDAPRAGEQFERNYMDRVLRTLRQEMDDLNARTGTRVDKARMNDYVNAKFPKKPMSTSEWANDLGVDAALACTLGLETILPEDERRRRDEAKTRKKNNAQAERDKKNMALDAMIMSGEKYDCSVYKKEQVAYRRKRLIEAGMPVPNRSAGRPKKLVCISPIDSPPPNRRVVPIFPMLEAVP